MSMIMYVLRVTPDQAATLKADPTLLEGVQHIASHASSGRSQSQILAELAEGISKLDPNFVGSPHDWQSQLKAKIERAVALNVEPAFCLEKEWHMLHYFLNGTGDMVDAPSGALFQGQDLGDDNGYGPARILSPEATAAFAAVCEPLTVSEIQARIDIPAMDEQKIYAAPFADDEYGLDELNEAISFYFPKFKDYIASASARGDGLLIWLS